MNYFYVKVFYTNYRIAFSAHVVRARSIIDAKRITEKHRISYPFHSKMVKSRLYQKLNINEYFNRRLIERRRKGIGGSIWYEDENGKLQKET